MLLKKPPNISAFLSNQLTPLDGPKDQLACSDQLIHRTWPYLISWIGEQRLQHPDRISD